MKEPKLTLNEVYNKTEFEGLEYALLHYFSGDEIADPKLSKLWKKARKSLKELNTYLLDNFDGDDDET
jgi:hypothetical protein